MLDSAFLIAKGRSQMLDLMAVQQAGRPVRASFLSLSSAIVAEIDLGSEALRFLGGLRFPLWAVYCLMKPQALEADLIYWPASAASEPPKEAPDVSAALPEGPWVTLSDNFDLFWATNMAWTNYDAHLAPGHNMGGGTWRLVLLRGVGRVALARFLLGMETAEHMNLEQTESLERRDL